MRGVVRAEGGTLMNRMAEGREAAALAERAKGLRTLRISERSVSDLELLGNGGFSPLTGFMGSADYQSVRDGMHLANGLPWSIPITLAVDAETAHELRDGKEVALAGPD